MSHDTTPWPVPPNPRPKPVIRSDPGWPLLVIEAAGKGNAARAKLNGRIVSREEAEGAAWAGLR